MSKQRLLNILIPTYNRDKELILNLSRIKRYIRVLGIENDVNILISDNGSSQNSISILRNYLESCGTDNFKLFIQQKNLGIEDNSLFLLDHCDSIYAMFLGDDDYFDCDLLERIICYLKKGTVYAILANYYQIDKEGNVIGKLRDPIQPDKIYKKGDFILAEKAHQLSCVTFRVEGVLNAYRKASISTLYPFVFFVGYNLSKGIGIHITEFPYRNTMIEKKNFNYEFDSLMSDLSESFDSIPFLSERNKKIAEWNFVKRKARRIINAETISHPIKFLCKVRNRYKINQNFKRIIMFHYVFSIILHPIVVLKIVVPKEIKEIIKKTMRKGDLR